MSSPKHARDHSHLDLPGNRPRVHPAQSHKLPPTALFQGPNSRNASHVSLSPQPERERPSPNDKQQHLPRAGPPSASFSNPRPTLVRELHHSVRRKNEDEFRADALWAEMQRTLADVELSAMHSSHVFSSAHAKALEELRMAQLSLGQAWAKSEADEIQDEEFGNDEPEASAVGTMKHGMFKSTSPSSYRNRSRQGSSSSTTGGRNLEEETDRDIQLARRRREANDRYFQQVNKSVLDVVGKLDEVANAMRRVEKESRDIWNDSSGTDDGGAAMDSGVDDAVVHMASNDMTETPGTPPPRSQPPADYLKAKPQNMQTPKSTVRLEHATPISKSSVAETPSTDSRLTDTPTS